MHLRRRDLRHPDQVVEPWHQTLAFEPQTTGNHTLTKRGEKAAIKRALNHDFVLPLHDFPARVEGGRVVAGLKHEVPGPELAVDEFAAEFASAGRGRLSGAR